MNKALRLTAILPILICLAFLAEPAQADQIVLKNGDKLTGTIGVIVGGSMTFTSPVLGQLTIKLTDLQSYATTQPARVRLKTGQIITAPISQGTATQIQTVPDKVTPTAQVRDVNTPAAKWTGNIVVNGELNRGNTYNDTVGLSALATLRRDSVYADDRTIVGYDYNVANTGRTRDDVTTTDNMDAMFEYDKFFTQKFYGYGDIGYLHDRIAALNVQLTPGVGVGYQWFEQPDFNFNTEGGITYLYKDYRTSGVQQDAAFRLAYHVDKQINEKVTIFNNAEFVAALIDPSNYIITADAGVQASLTNNFFSQFKVQYRRADRPAAGLLKDDLGFLLGVGWKF
jgi:putative salt-induced outer membrane protein YdiY